MPAAADDLDELTDWFDDESDPEGAYALTLDPKAPITTVVLQKMARLRKRASARKKKRASVDGASFAKNGVSMATTAGDVRHCPKKIIADAKKNGEVILKGVY
jgi:hypothetical protein